MQAMKYEGQKVLILAPHADDEVLGCGGIIQKYISHNSSVRILFGSFVMGSYQKYKKEKGQYVDYSGSARLKELQESLKVLGVTDCHFLYVDHTEPIKYHSQLDEVPKIELVNKIEQHIQDYQPTVIFIPSYTKHQDHKVLHEVGITVTRPYFWNGSVLVFETDGELDFQPNLFVELTQEELNKKLNALNQYKTQLGGKRHPVNLRSQAIRASFRGQAIYSDYAEAFQIIRLYG